jgi:hypothetical protein
MAPKLQEFQPLSSGLPKLTESDFDGGQDNLQAVVKAASTAGETKDGAVLWIHGAQPTLNKELYVMAPYIQTPAFYELALDNGVTDGNEFFKNHREIGPFSPVPRNGSIKNDLTRFVSKWKPGGVEYDVKLSTTNALPKIPFGSVQQANELSQLSAKEQSQTLIGRGDLHGATTLAVNHQLVTPVSSAIVLTRGSNAAGYLRQVNSASVSDPANMDDRSEASSTSDAPSSDRARTESEAPQLEGATNGSVGDGDTYVSGVNTAGTVRVNNLANLEAMLNILTNMFELLAIVYGLGVIVQAVLFRTAYAGFFGLKGAPVPVMVIFGVVIVAAGLACPGVVNWFVASARDANLFS